MIFFSVLKYIKINPQPHQNVYYSVSQWHSHRGINCIISKCQISCDGILHAFQVITKIGFKFLCCRFNSAESEKNHLKLFSLTIWYKLKYPGSTLSAPSEYLNKYNTNTRTKSFSVLRSGMHSRKKYLIHL